MRSLSPNCSLEEAKLWLRERVKDGAKCPCCTQFAKVYRRKINSLMAGALILIARFFRAKTDPWLHVPSYLHSQTLSSGLRTTVRGGDWAKLLYWKCLEPKPGEREDGSTRIGFWRITPLGNEFVSGAVKLPKYARIYDDRCLGLTGELVTVQDALGDRFDYDELMRGE